jgi:hypothetical protein
MRAVALSRAGSVPISPVYQMTVSADVPATRLVAVSNGGPATRCGGFSKKFPAAAMADAAVSDVSASLSIAAVSAVCRFAAVMDGVAPIVNSFGPGVVEAVAAA